MLLSARLRRGLLAGSAVATLYFVADLTGASLAIGFLFDPTWAQVVLLLVAGSVTIAAGGVLGAIASAVGGPLWPKRWHFRMPRRWLYIAAVLAAAATGVGGYALRVDRQLADPGPRPQVVGTVAPVLLVVIDTLRADALYGPSLDFPLAKNIRALAQNAVVFTDAESAAGWTIPATATLLTGIHPEALYSARGYLPDWAPTIAERLHAAGYQTAAVVDNTLLEPRTGFADGFESFFQRSAMRFAFTFPGLRAIPTLWRELLRESMQVFYYGAPRLTDQAVARINSAGDAPLFLYVHYMDVHYPYHFHEEYGPDPKDAEPLSLQIAMDRLRDDHSAVPSAGQMRFLRHRYANEIRYVDNSIGRLLAAWKKRFGNKGVIVVTADHGEEFLEHGELGHGNSLYRELVHVPVIMQMPQGTLPKERAGLRVDAPFASVNVLPTTLAAAGVSLELGSDGFSTDGQSWLPVLRGEAEPFNTPLFASQNRHARRIYRYREGEWALIFTHTKGHFKQELFDLNNDPGEHHSTTASEGERVAAMTSRYTPFVDRQVAARDPKPSQARDNPQALRALGYVQ